MRRTLVASIAILALAVAGCSSSDPTASEEYQALGQELVQTESELAEMAIERDVLADEASAVAVASEEAVGLVVPEEIAALIEDWFAANELGDGSVLDLYLPEGYHLYGDERFEYDEIVGHLSGGNSDHEWITEPLLIADEGNGRYVVVRGMRVVFGGVYPHASALMFEIFTTPDDALRFAQTAWFYDNEWGY